jgi:cardiolipin synthase
MFTISFLQIWNYQAETNTPYEEFLLPHKKTKVPYNGYVIPFSDSPTDENDTGKLMHLNMINCAQDYFWITTPYLILDQEMISALTLAISNGVDVRIVVPGIPDKKMVYEVTKANFDILIKKGVKIYEYTPGFIHGKVALADDRSALVGTVNMDFRSYYLHYECGVWVHDVDCIKDIKEDFEEIFKASHLVTLEECMKTNFIVRTYRNVLKVFSPIL